MTKNRVIISVLVLIIIWQLFSFLINRPILPSPWDVMARYGLEIVKGKLGIHLLASLLRLIAGMGLAVIAGSISGLILGQSKRTNQILAPFIYLLFPIPKVVFVPIIMLLFGIGDLSKIIIIFIILFFQILVLVRDQAIGIRPELIQSVKSLGAGRRALFRFVYLPASVPAILTAIRQSVGTAMAVLYIAELFATQKGLGYYIYFQGSTLFDYPAMYAGVITMSLLGMGMYFLVDYAEKRFCKWMVVT